MSIEDNSKNRISISYVLVKFDMVGLSRAYHNLIAKNVYLQTVAFQIVVKTEKKLWVLPRKNSFLRPCNVNSCMILQSVVTRDTFKPTILWVLSKTDLCNATKITIYTKGQLLT